MNSNWKKFKIVFFLVYYCNFSVIILTGFFRDFQVFPVLAQYLIPLSVLSFPFLILLSFMYYSEVELRKGVWIHQAIGVLLITALVMGKLPCLELYFKLNRSALAEMAQYIEDDNGVYEISTCFRGCCVNSINSNQVKCFAHLDNDYIPSHCKEGMELDDILDSQGVDSDSFVHFLDLFVKHKFSLAKKENNYVLLLRRRLWSSYKGYVFTNSNTIPLQGSRVTGYKFVAQVNHLDANWYDIVALEDD